MSHCCTISCRMASVAYHTSGFCPILGSNHKVFKLQVLWQQEKMPFGISQWSILGSTLFLIYVNGLNSAIQNLKLIQFADNTTLCFTGTTQQVLDIDSFLELNLCIQYFSGINRTINSSKLNMFNLCPKKVEPHYQLILMAENVILEDSNSVKFLGIQIDCGVNSEGHINYVCSTVASGIFGLWSLAHFCSLDVLKMAYIGLIHPYLLYGFVLWGSCSKHNIEWVFEAQKICHNNL